MTDILGHRGPDAAGHHLTGAVGLGHRRLRIIDLVDGKQPMYNEDGSLVIVFNGEIYNFQDLRQQLQSHGHIFKTKSDTEVLLHGYEQWQTGLLSRLRGMFAFAIWDDRRRALVLARDRLGKKPLYYFADAQGIVFGSELKSLLVDPEVPREIDTTALDAYFSLGYIPSPWTIFLNIRKLPPASYLLWKDGQIEQAPYWKVTFNGHGEYEEEQAIANLRSNLTEAVRVRLISDVPIGAFLSGGLDSSCVVSMMSNLMNEPVIAASVGFGERAYNELEFSRQVAKHCGIQMHEHMVAPEVQQLLPKLIWHFDEPFADPSSVPTYYVSKVAREHVTVALSGDGGDENFAGYTRRYQFEALESYWRQRIPAIVRNRLIRPLAQIYPKADWLPRFLRAKSVLTNISSAPARAYCNSLSIMPPALKQRLCADEFTKTVNGDLAFSLFSRLFDESNTTDPLSRAQYVDLHTFLSEYVLTKVDRMSMAHGLEVRSPLLDHEIVELAASLPSHAKLRDGTSKHILKKAMSGILPDEIIYRRKHGFDAPVGKWLKHELKDMATDILFDTSKHDGIIHDQALRKIWHAHQIGTGDFSAPLWTILIYKLWVNQIYNGARATVGKNSIAGQK
jgi:asparagine synthase (glutamine-hydrolysing)